MEPMGLPGRQEQQVHREAMERMVQQEQQVLLATTELTAPLGPLGHREATEQTVLQELREQQALLVTTALTGPPEQRVQLAITELTE